MCVCVCLFVCVCGGGGGWFGGLMGLCDVSAGWRELVGRGRSDVLQSAEGRKRRLCFFVSDWADPRATGA
jgi:hypothetical protein